MKWFFFCVVFLFVMIIVNVQVEWVFNELFLDSIKIFVVFQWGEYLFNFIYWYGLKLVVGNEEELEVFFFVI